MDGLSPGLFEDGFLTQSSELSGRREEVSLCRGVIGGRSSVVTVGAVEDFEIAASVEMCVRLAQQELRGRDDLRARCDKCDGSAVLASCPDVPLRAGRCVPLRVTNAV